MAGKNHLSQNLSLVAAGMILMIVFISTPAKAISVTPLPDEATVQGSNRSEGASKREEGSSKTSSPAGGGLFTGIYLGASMPKDEDQHIRAFGFGVVAESTEGNVNFDDSITSGIRIGYWSKSRRWLGFALDVSYFQMDSKRKDISIYPISTLLMLRLPKHRFQPYICIGPSLFINKMEFSVDLSGLSVGGTGKFKDTSYDMGLDTRAGVSVNVYRNTALFAEYRFTHYSAKYTDSITNVTVDIDTNSNTHHTIIGISWRF